MILIILFYNLIFNLFVSNKNENKAEDKKKYQVEISDSASLLTSNNDLAFNLYKKLSPDNENLFFSPFSISTALAMSYAGAKGETRNQLKKVLNITKSDSIFYNSFKEQYSTINGGENPINICNALWADNNLKVQETYINRLECYFKSEFRKTDFTGNLIESCNDINNWAKQRTNGRINNILSPQSINPLTKLIITNVIYFNMEWDYKFPKEQTKKDKFFDCKHENDSVWYMNNLGNYKYYEDKIFQVLEIPYEWINYSMLIFLPKNKLMLNQVESAINAKKYEEYVSSLHICDVLISIPKFKLSNSYEITPVLSQLGMPDAFTPQADFSGIAKDNMLRIDKISHNTFIEIDEEKTEATASTLTSSISLVGPIKLEKKIFKANSPFMFMIVYRNYNINQILFIGNFQNLN